MASCLPSDEGRFARRYLCCEGCLRFPHKAQLCNSLLSPLRCAGMARMQGLHLLERCCMQVLGLLVLALQC